ncbi:LRR receptor-like serine threonine-protein kinase [Seminavis robusta]|uniref:LRR receptor-like serine threonine-protein kinase n=1 Tax=Seminavis robusta TaxID=568900 RepID=A0A9N8EGL8_9STRA|nr:LRR receptor-like serine threonine-protein kinase [Seminavis robusta]|eukprot:Sro1161_g247810.1 LRR receptor-like serine threonine-protein kinase (1095) ;mRNA; f:25722-29087
MTIHPMKIKRNNNDDNDDGLDELDLLKIAEARAKGDTGVEDESQALLNKAQDDHAVQASSSSRRTAKAPARTRRTRRQHGATTRRTPAPSTGPSNDDEVTSDGVAGDEELEMVKILEARARATAHQGNAASNTEDHSPVQVAPSHYTSKAVLRNRRDALEEDYDDPEILKIVQARAEKANKQEEKTEELADAPGNASIKTAAQVSSSSAAESRPGAYAGAPGVVLQRADTMRYSRIGIVQPLSMSSLMSDMGTSQKSKDFQVDGIHSSRSGLMVANLVTEPSHQNLPFAEELDFIDENDIEEQKAESKRRALIGALKWLASGVVIVVVIVLAVVLGTRKKTPPTSTAESRMASTEPTTSVMPSFSPSSLPSEAPLSSRLAIKGLPENIAEAIGRPGTPQQKAYDWTFRHPEFDGMPNWQKQQLFALGTFYFSFENWPDDYHWMDYGNSECFWTTELDSHQEGPSTMDWMPEGYFRHACMMVSGINLDYVPDPWISNCNDEGHFHYMKLKLSTWDGPPVHGTLPPEVFLLTGLTILDIHDAGITGSIPSEIGMLSILTNLNLHTNQITGKIPSEVGRLPLLQKLDLHSNQISGSIPAILGKTNLTGLHLDDNAISGTLPAGLGSLSGLKLLELQSNRISGTLPPELANCSGLIRLNARNNSLTGLSSEIGLMTSLNFLLLRDNQIEGTIPSEIGLLSNLLYLSMERNSITAFPFSFNQSVIYQLDLQDNQLSFIPSEIGWLGDSVGEVDLSNNNIAILPSELFLLTSLVALHLDGNQIKHLPKEIEQMTNLEPCRWGWLSLSNNKLTSIPVEIGRLTDLQSWTMDSNRISAFPDVDWSSLSNLKAIQLSHNLLSSSVPSEVGLLQQLIELDLSSNGLIGSIPSEIGNLENSSSCWGTDSFFGAYESNCAMLLLLDLHNNSLTGSLATEMARLTGLEVLDISFNKISGPIPSELGQLLTTLTKYNATLDDYVEKETSLIQTLDLSNNQLSGWLPSELGLLTSLETLDLSFNSLTGTIPSELGNFNASASAIMLLGNEFSGRLPESLCPRYCATVLCSVESTASNIFVPNPDCSMVALFEVDCSSESLLDCSICSCA